MISNDRLGFFAVIANDRLGFCPMIADDRLAAGHFHAARRTVGQTIRLPVHQWRPIAANRPTRIARTRAMIANNRLGLLAVISNDRFGFRPMIADDRLGAGHFHAARRTLAVC
mgnify:CR=1 FL=1